MSKAEHFVEPKMEPRGRLEVSGTGDRRPWTSEQKARIIAESNASGGSVSAVARRHGLTPQQLYRWRSHDRHQAGGAHGKGVTFAPVMLEPAREDQSRRNAPIPTIEIEIGAMTVRVSAGCDPTTLQMVLRLVTAS
jgi:transposase